MYFVMSLFSLLCFLFRDFVMSFAMYFVIYLLRSVVMYCSRSLVMYGWFVSFSSYFYLCLVRSFVLSWFRFRYFVRSCFLYFLALVICLFSSLASAFFRSVVSYLFFASVRSCCLSGFICLVRSFVLSLYFARALLLYSYSC